MTTPMPTKEQVVREMRVLLARAHGRLILAEAAGTLTPDEARLMAAIRARGAREAAEQPPSVA